MKNRFILDGVWFFLNMNFFIIFLHRTSSIRDFLCTTDQPKQRRTNNYTIHYKEIGTQPTNQKLNINISLLLLVLVEYI